MNAAAVYDSTAIEPSVCLPPADCPPAAPRRTLGVLHVINGEHYAGAERVQDLLAGALPEFGFHVGFACLKPGRFPTARKCTDASLARLAMRNRFDLGVVRQLVDLVRAGDYRILHAHTPRTAMLARLASQWCGIPFVYHVHSPTARDSTRHWQNWANTLVERISLLGASFLIAVSRSLREHMLAAGYARDRIAVVPNGVPCVEVPAERPAPSGTWTLGSVALMRPRKGIEVLLEAVALLRRDGCDVRLEAVGPFETPEYERQVRGLAATLGVSDAVAWPGFTSNVNASLARFDLFVLPSLFGEGMPMVVLEAMAAGVPVIGTRVEGIPEVIRDQVDGLLAQPGDAADLARVIARVMHGDVSWNALRSSALIRQAAHFSDHSMARGVAEVYRRVLRG